MKIIFECGKCGKEAPIDKEKTTENWVVYGTKCDVCGEKTNIKLTH